MFWSEDPSGLVAAHFSSIFFSMMALESNVTMLEAYALALFSTQVCVECAASSSCRSQALSSAALRNEHIGSTTAGCTSQALASAISFRTPAAKHCTEFFRVNMCICCGCSCAVVGTRARQVLLHVFETCLSHVENNM
jgi:hypothetical protein